MEMLRIIFVIVSLFAAVSSDFAPGHIIVCSQHSHCQKYGDSAGRCNDLVGQCTCGVGFTSLQLGLSPSSVYKHCFPSNGGEAARVSPMTAVVTLTFGTADCSKVSRFETEFKSIVATALQGTSITISKIVHTCLNPKNPLDGLYTAIQVEGRINDFTPGKPLMILPAKIQELIDASTVSSIRLYHQRFENLVELDGIQYSCPNPDGSVVRGWHGSNICVAVTCADNYIINDGACLFNFGSVTSSGGETLSGGEIAGISIGVTAFVILFIIMIYFMCNPKDYGHKLGSNDKTTPDKQ